ncbi:MAG: LptF/LptG family permease [FCB group bacterium]|jgi:lipopolysaccharide export system permease protein
MTILDRYILKQLILTLLFSLIALSSIFVIVNLMENLDQFIDQHATIIIIIKYYVHFLPEILKLIAPIAMLISTLFSIGKFSNNNEITAMKSGGVSLYRIMIPISAFSIVLCFVQLYFNGWIVPSANEKKLDIEQKYLNKSSSGASINNLYLRDTPNRIIIMQYYDEIAKSGIKISIEDFTSTITPRLVNRIEADKMTWDPSINSWKVFNGIERTYSATGANTRKFDVKPVFLNVTHNQIIELKRSVDEMSFNELRSYIDILKMGGKDVRRQMIDYYGGYAYPFAHLIVVLFGVPFASIRKKGGLAIQIAAVLVITFVYLVFTKVSQTIGYSSDINPILTAWMANILFFLLALFVISRTRT